MKPLRIIITRLSRAIAAVYAYVIMSSHVHLVARRREGELSDFIRDFKSFTAKSIIREIEQMPTESRRDWLLFMLKYFAKHEKQNKTYMVWQKTGHPLELFTPAVIDQKIEYIHQNPVKAGICTEASFYHYSSANPIGEISLNEA